MSEGTFVPAAERLGEELLGVDECMDVLYVVLHNLNHAAACHGHDQRRLRLAATAVEQATLWLGAWLS